MKKGQGAFEYLMTYGWAILVVIIVGIVLWKSGLFGTSSTGTSGFTALIPAEWKFDNSTAAGASTVIWRNAAGSSLKSVTMAYSGDCVNASVGGVTVGAGQQYTQNVTCTTACSPEGGSATVTVVVSYTSEGTIAHTETGKIYAKCE